MKKMFSLKSFMPQTLMGRSLLILIIPVILTQIGATIFFFDNHWDKMTSRLAFSLAGEIAIVADQIENNYSPERLKRISGLLAQSLDLLVSFEPDAVLEDQGPHHYFGDRLIISPLLIALDEQVRRKTHVHVDLQQKFVEIEIQLSNGVLTFLSPEKRLFSSSGYVFILWLIGSSFILLLISIIFMRNQVRPIRKLAVAAERMGMGRDMPNFRPTGAREVRQAAEAFETMQRRIRRQIEQRTAMLAGVSHDLRTPLTRLKLQLSMLEEEEEANAMRKDLEEMERMINAYLDFAKGETSEASEIVELKSFIQDLIPDYKHTNTEISLSDNTDSARISLQPINFKRCLDNILSNACRYADKVVIRIRRTEDRVYLTIEDNGPGIPEDQYEEVFKPFVRLDPSRSQETGGVGLGLSVAMDIILSHGGKISLDRSKDLGGVLVSIRLPM